MSDREIIALIVGALAGYWWAKEQERKACKCAAQAGQAADPLAWLGSWQT